jgi:hypothetical protein
MPIDEADERRELFAGTAAIVHQVLGIKNLRHRSSLDTLSKAWPTSRTMASLAKRLFEQVSTNWRTCRERARRRPSSENWRWGRPVLNIAEHNRSPEVVLERAIIRACGDVGRTDWCNQIPVASGVVDSYAHKRSALDLVHREDSGAFEFIELKIRSDIPLFAAIEVVQYGLIWLLSRRDQVPCGYVNRTLLEADTIDLRVLAPSSFYNGRDLSPLAEALNVGVRAVGLTHDNTALSFQFQEFPDALLRTHGYSNEEALAIIDERRPR